MPAPSPITVDQLLAHEGRLRALVRSILRDDQATDDVLQDTWIAALTRPPRRAAALGGWLTAVARNYALKAIRGDGARGRREQAAAGPEAAPSTAEIVAREAARREVIEVLLAQDEPYRSALVLHYCEGLPPRAIAKRLGTPAATVRTHLHRGIQRMRGAFDARHNGDRAAWRSALAVAWGITIGGSAEAAEPAGTAQRPNGGWTMTGTITGIAASLALLVGAGLWLTSEPAPIAPPTHAAAVRAENGASAGAPAALGVPARLPGLPADIAARVGAGDAAAPPAVQESPESDPAVDGEQAPRGRAPQRVRLAIDDRGAVRLQHSTVPGQFPGDALNADQVFNLLGDAVRAASDVPEERRAPAKRLREKHERYTLRFTRPAGAAECRIHLNQEPTGYGGEGVRVALDRIAASRIDGSAITVEFSPVGHPTVADITEALQMVRLENIRNISFLASHVGCEHLGNATGENRNFDGLHRPTPQNTDLVAEIAAPAELPWSCVSALISECAMTGIVRVFVGQNGGALVDASLPTDGGMVAEIEEDEHGNPVGPLSPQQERRLKEWEAAAAEQEKENELKRR